MRRGRQGLEAAQEAFGVAFLGVNVLGLKLLILRLLVFLPCLLPVGTLKGLDHVLR